MKSFKLKRKETASGLILAASLTFAFGCQNIEKRGTESTTTGNRTPASGPLSSDDKGWNEYGGLRTEDRMGEKFSSLEQINVGNVKKLKKLWVYNTGEKDIPGPKSLEVTPVYHSGKLYGCTIFNKVFAIDAETGQEVWSHDPQVRKSEKVWAYKCRGVSLWTDSKSQGQLCSTRVLSSTIDGRLLALDAETGKRCPDFVDRINGQPVPGAAPGEVAAWVNVMIPYNESDRVAFVTKQKDHPYRDEFYITSAPLILQDLAIIGGGIADNGRVHATSGAVQAFDVRTGELKWVWDPAPPGLKKPGQFLTQGTPNAWAPMAADDSRGLIFIPTGAAAPDYYGVKRNGRDQYANSVVALRVAQNGQLLNEPKVEWQFKTVIQDKWDYDAASQPVLTDLQVNGRPTPVVIQATKMGFVFIMDRETGKPIFPTANGFFTGSYKDLLKEVSVKGLVKEEKVIADINDFVTETPDGKVTFGVDLKKGTHSKYQPFPPKEWDLHDTPTTKKELIGFLAKTTAPGCREMTEKYAYEGIYTPPSIQGAINFPGAVGGVDWGGVTIDPVNQILYVNQIRIATIAQLIPRQQYNKMMASIGHAGPKAFKEAYFDMLGTPYGLHRFPYMDAATNLPCSDPPYGILKAISLRDGKVLWEHVFGDFAEMTAFVMAEKARAQAQQAATAQTGDVAAAKDQTALQAGLAKLKEAIAAKAKAGIVKVHSYSAGVPNFGGSLATKGKVLFIAAAADSKFRMYNSETGSLLHEIKLDEFPGAGSGAATPMTFMSNKGRQIVVLASGGNKFIPGKQGDAIVAFALED